MRTGLLCDSRPSRVRLRALLIAALPAALLAGPAAAGITGVCPDGSIFVVQSEQDVPCSAAKRVEPHEVPPLRPEYLPRPYTWEVYRSDANPNNPYNLIDAARKVRELRDGTEPQPPVPETAAVPAPPSVAAGPPQGAGPVELGLSEAELRDLFSIVELSQQLAPASFVQETADGRELLRISLAHAASFDARLREARRAAGGRTTGSVLLFTAAARGPERFEGHFTFVQGHLAYQPEAGNADHLGVLQGHLGALQVGEIVLGYVMLPEELDLGAPVDVYYHDRRRTVTFRP